MLENYTIVLVSGECSLNVPNDNIHRDLNVADILKMVLDCKSFAITVLDNIE